MANGIGSSIALPNPKTERRNRSQIVAIQMGKQKTNLTLIKTKAYE
jgi:hypothetical protein